MTTKKAHAKFSASGAARWLACPGSIQLTELAPPPVESKYAAEGTEAHTVFEEFLRGKKRPNRPASMSTKDYSLVKMAASYVKGRHLARGENAELLIEESIALPVNYPGQFGTVDAAVVEHFGTLMVIDYKHGQGLAVNVEGNPQLMYYALGLAARYDFGFSDVEIIVLQPRCESPEGWIKREKVSISTLTQWKEVFEKGIEAALAEDAPLIPGDKQCRFCPAAVICPAISANAIKSAMISFDKVVEEKTLPPVTHQSLTPDSLSKTLDALELIDVWAGKVREFAFNALNQGVEIPGYKLVEKRGVRKWVDEDEVAIEAKKLFGLKAFSKPELLSPAQIEKALGAEGLDFTAKRTSTASSGLKLARAADARPPKSIVSGFDRQE